MKKNYKKTSEGQITDILSSNQLVLEKALQMRSYAFLSDIKASLLTQTLFEVDARKKQIQSYSEKSDEQRKLIEQQKLELLLVNEELLKGKKELESKVRERTRELKDEIGERQSAERALRESEERFRAIVENSPDAISLKDIEGRYLLVNRNFEDLAGVGSGDIIGKTSEQVFDSEFAQSSIEHDRAVVTSGRTIQHDEELEAAGHIVNLLTNKFPIFGKDGEVIAIGGVSLDITERKNSEERLRRAQRMEALGQLTGGLAHDFNNLLSVMSGNMELLELKLGEKEEVEQCIEAIRHAVTRGTSLTRRLLAFSRKQPLTVVATDVTDLIGGLEDMLLHTLEKTIDLKVQGAPDLWPAMIDPHQFEDALLNLVINARDAMPTGGALVIETANASLDEVYAKQHAELTPGDYVMVAVRDTGAGMSSEVLEKACEPFFTTKSVGRGSGLGLSMVYGFAKQSNGHITIYSEIGHGTTVKLYLPRSLEAAIP